MKKITGTHKSSVRHSAAHGAYASIAQRAGGLMRNHIDLGNTPLMVAQRKKLESLFGISQLKMNMDAATQFSVKDEEEEEELAQRQDDGKSSLERTAQRMDAATQFSVKDEEEEEELTQRQVDDKSSPERTMQRTENKTGIPDSVKQKMESSFNADFSGVKVHANSSKAPGVGALAYTQGSDIHFAPGQFSPSSSRGQSLLGHELAHVVQQSQGRVRPTTKVAGMPVNDDSSLEREADALGKKAVSG